MEETEARKWIARISDPQLRAKTEEVWNRYKGLHPGQAENFARGLLANPGSTIGFVQLFGDGRKIEHRL